MIIFYNVQSKIDIIIYPYLQRQYLLFEAHKRNYKFYYNYNT